MNEMAGWQAPPRAVPDDCWVLRHPESRQQKAVALPWGI